MILFHFRNLPTNFDIMKLKNTKFCFILNFAVLFLSHHYTASMNTTTLFECSTLGLGSYMGCYQCSPFFGCNNAVNQLLNQGYYDLPYTNSPLNCAELCAKDGYVFSGVENNRACFCGNFFNLQVSRQVADAECNTICPGDNTQTCGAWSFIQVYSTSILACSSTTTTTTTTDSTTTTTATQISTITTSTPTTATTRAPTITTTNSTTTTPTLTKILTTTTTYPATQISTTTTSTPTTATTQAPTTTTTNSTATTPTLTKTSTAITTNPSTIIFTTTTSTPTTATTIAPTTTTVPNCCPAQGVWSQWSEPIGCNDTCGACGTATRNRYCMTAGNGCPCTGDNTQNVPCNLAPCKYPRKSCCIGKAIGFNGTVICNVSTPIETPPSSACTTIPSPVCPPSGGTWSEWSTSQTCSHICGSCAKLSYIRTCTSGPSCPCIGNSSKTINCNIAPCHYPRNSCCEPYRAMSENGQIICGPQVSQHLQGSL